MALTYSDTFALGTQAPDFTLPAVNPNVDDRGGSTRSLDDYEDKPVLVIVFMCNHCPYVKTMEDRLLQTARDYQDRGVQFVGICSNDGVAYPDDSFEALAEKARSKSFPFPYLQDESQDVARAYGAVCTPDLFVYNADRERVYQGRFDDGRPSNPEVTSHDLRNALDELLETGTITSEQVPSMGCNIKWKAT